MNQRNSTGLPLRAMVMVLLFLGVVFLLVGFQAMGSDGEDDSEQAPIATTTMTPAPESPAESPAPERPEVRVYNISDVQGAAQGVADRLREDGWNVVETGNLPTPPADVTTTTVYYSEGAPGERDAAEELGRLLEAPVAVRVPEVADRPPGVVVVVTG